MEDDRELLSIGEVAEASGLRTSALRYYEEEGLIRPAARVGGKRHYRPSTLRRLAIVALCQEVGFTVAEIAELLARGRGGHERWRRLAERKLDELDGHIDRARATRDVLRAALACGCGDPASCDMVAEAGQRRLLSVGPLRTEPRSVAPGRGSRTSG